MSLSKSLNYRACDVSYDETIMRLRDEFDEKFDEHKVSDSSEKLKEFKFLTILGQGAFGLVVISHSSFSSLNLHNFFASNRNS